MTQIEILFYYLTSTITLLNCQTLLQSKKSGLDDYSTVEAFCPVFHKKPIFKFPPRCGKEHSSCSSDKDCGIELKCCYDGCISSCELPTIKPVKKMSWFIDETKRLLKMIPCKTIAKSTRKSTCPSGYVCRISKDKSKRNLNQGFCIYSPREGLSAHIPAFIEEKLDKGCTLKGKYYADGEHFVDNCKFCFCRNTVINCNLRLRCNSKNHVD